MNWWTYARKPSVSEQRRRATREGDRLAKRLAKDGRKLSPVLIEGRAIAHSFWGKAWCGNLEAYRDYEYRLPRGRSYVRNGAVLDLAIQPGRITALVSGSAPRPYEVEIKIKALAKCHWARVKAQCGGAIGSLIELLEGRLSDRVMGIVTDPEQGLFPKPKEIDMTCSCPDWATMCKHVAAVMYGVGARLDAQPELLFALHHVDHNELIAEAADLEVSRDTHRKTIGKADLASVFGIELAEESVDASQSAQGASGRRAPKVRSAPKSQKAAVKGRAKRTPPKATKRGIAKGIRRKGRTAKV